MLSCDLSARLLCDNVDKIYLYWHNFMDAHCTNTPTYPVRHFGSQIVYKGIEPQNGWNGSCTSCGGVSAECKKTMHIIVCHQLWVLKTFCCCCDEQDFQHNSRHQAEALGRPTTPKEKCWGKYSCDMRQFKDAMSDFWPIWPNISRD